MPQNLLTDAKVRNAKPQATPFKLADGGGLFLLVRPNGAKLWRWKFRLAGKEGLFAVGVFPPWGSLARATRGTLRARSWPKGSARPTTPARSGGRTSPTPTRGGGKPTGRSGKLAEAWLEDGKAIWAAGTYRQKRSRVDTVPDARPGRPSDHADRPDRNPAHP